jgi:hypothetical protein
VVLQRLTDTELGIYPRALADIHNHIKLRFSDPDLGRSVAGSSWTSRAGVPWAVVIERGTPQARSDRYSL